MRGDHAISGVRRVYLDDKPANSTINTLILVIKVTLTVFSEFHLVMKNVI